MSTPTSNGTPAIRRTVSVPEAARIVGIGRSTLYEHVRTGLVPSLRIGGRVVIPTEVIETFLQSALTPRP